MKKTPPRKKPLDVLPIREVAERFLLEPEMCVINRPTLINLLAQSDKPDASTVNRLKYQIKRQGDMPGKLRNASTSKSPRTVYRFVLRSYLPAATGIDPFDYCRKILELRDSESLCNFYRKHAQKMPECFEKMK